MTATVKQPHVSIVIPMFNREALIRETLASIQRQEVADWECVVVDDGSQDGSRQVVQRLAQADTRIKLVRRPGDQPKGPSTCRNHGFKESSGTWVWFVDSDDLVAEGALARMLNESMNGSADCLVGMYRYLGESASTDRPPCWNFEPRNAYIDHVTQKCPLLPWMAVWRRSFLQGRQAMLWHPQVLFNEGYEFHARVLADRPKINRVNKVIIEYRIHDGCQSLAISRAPIDYEEKARIRLAKLDARLRVLEGLVAQARSPAEKRALDQVRWRILVQLKRDSRHVQIKEALARFRALLLKDRSLRGLLRYLMVPIILKTGRGFRLVGSGEAD